MHCIPLWDLCSRGYVGPNRSECCLDGATKSRPRCRCQGDDPSRLFFFSDVNCSIAAIICGSRMTLTSLSGYFSQAKYGYAHGSTTRELPRCLFLIGNPTILGAVDSHIFSWWTPTEVVINVTLTDVKLAVSRRLWSVVLRNQALVATNNHGYLDVHPQVETGN